MQHVIWIYDNSCYLAKEPIYRFHHVKLQERCVHTVSILLSHSVTCMDTCCSRWWSFESRILSFICSHFLLSTVVSSFSSFTYIVFLIVLLRGIFCEFSVFILQIVSTFLGVAGSGFWAMFVIQQTNRLMQPLIFLYVYMDRYMCIYKYYIYYI